MGIHQQQEFSYISPYSTRDLCISPHKNTGICMVCGNILTIISYVYLVIKLLWTQLC